MPTRRRRSPSKVTLKRATVCSGWVGVVLFFVAVGVVGADDELLRKALDQLSSSYANAQRQLRDREIATQTLIASLAIARSESDLFQRLWSESQMRVQTLGGDLAETELTSTHRQLMATLQRLYVTDVDRQRLTVLLSRLMIAIESNREIAVELAVTREFLSEKSVGPERSVRRSALTGARVLEVNPKLRLVVLDVGALQGARLGMPLIILRGDRMVAEVRIVEVRSKICGALVEKVENNVTLQAGDSAQVTKG